MTYLTIVIGLICAALGMWGTLETWPLMRQAVLVMVLTVMTLGGVLAVLIGASELLDNRNRRRNAERSKTESSSP